MVRWCANKRCKLKWVDATYPFTSSPFGSSVRAAEVEAAMSSDWGFWSRAMESDCDVITAIRGGSLDVCDGDLVGASRHEGAVQQAPMDCAPTNTQRKLWGMRSCNGGDRDVSRSNQLRRRRGCKISGHEIMHRKGYKRNNTNF